MDELKGGWTGLKAGHRIPEFVVLDIKNGDLVNVIWYDPENPISCLDSMNHDQQFFIPTIKP